MRHLSLLLLTLVLLAGCTSETNPLGVNEATDHTLASSPHEGDAAAQKASSQTERDVIYLNLTIPSVCLTEMVHLEGPVAVRIHTTTDGRGVMHQKAFYSWKDVVATGQTSGTTWHTTAAVELYTMLNYEFDDPFQPIPSPTQLGDPAVFHHAGAIQFIADGDAPNLYIRHLVQTVVDPDGNVRNIKDHLELLDCR